MRIGADGSDVLVDTPVGVVTNIFPEYSDFETDAGRDGAGSSARSPTACG